jgi:hypothetical protein
MGSLWPLPLTSKKTCLLRRRRHQRKLKTEDPTKNIAPSDSPPATAPVVDRLIVVTSFDSEPNTPIHLASSNNTKNFQPLARYYSWHFQCPIIHSFIHSFGQLNPKHCPNLVQFSLLWRDQLTTKFQRLNGIHPHELKLRLSLHTHA